MTEQSGETFFGLGIAPKLLEILETNGFTKPTPIQQKAIPVAIDGKDLIGIAQTGTGKTLAFGVPMLQNLAKTGGQGLVLLPTRELAQQVDESLTKIGKTLGLRTAIVVGGASMGRQITALKNKPHIIVATPGRLIDHMDRGKTTLRGIRVLVLDEADRMLDMGFAPQIQKILQGVPKERQTMLFSATMPKEIVTIAQKHMALPMRVEIARPGTTAEHIEQEVYFVQHQKKRATLDRLLQRHRGSVLIFTRTKWGAKKLTSDLRKAGHTSAELHANRTLGQRRAALAGFKDGTFRVLVATDIAARGIDVQNIELVVNYDLPSTPDDYVHRIGRTARAGKHGKAITFAMPDQTRDLKDIERLIKTQIKVADDSLPVPQGGTSSPRRTRPPRRAGNYGRSRGASSNRPSGPGGAKGKKGKRRFKRGDYRDVQLPRERPQFPKADGPKPIGYTSF